MMRGLDDVLGFFQFLKGFFRGATDVFQYTGGSQTLAIIFAVVILIIGIVTGLAVTRLMFIARQKASEINVYAGILAAFFMTMMLVSMVKHGYLEPVVALYNGKLR
ncbi:MAG: hypothetical protein H7X92_14920 [Chitinophagales bacterium]|nr:hypothetical protein [Hyphomicrobiales bacterium]